MKEAGKASSPSASREAANISLPLFRTIDTTEPLV
jgi:hypothetical protein